MQRDTTAAAPPHLEALRECAFGLVPALRERAAQCESLARLPDATIDALRSARLFRMFEPVRYGGAEVHVRGFVEIGAILGRGCGSTSWVFNNIVGHNWMLGYWPGEAQDEVWRDDPDTLVGSGLIFRCGKAERVPGGYRLTGQWPFSSGIDPSRWVMLGALLAADGGEPAPHFFLVPEADYRVIDTWQVMGLAGTGSKDVAVDGIFVPAHRVVPAAVGKGGPHPGSAANPGPLFRLPWYPLFGFVNGATALGIAQGAVEQFTAAMQTRAATYSGRSLADLATMQLRVAEAATMVDAAETLMLKGCDEAWRFAETGMQPPLADRARWRRDGAFAAGLAVKAVDLLFAGAGGGAIQEQNPLQRAFRDVHAAAGHINLSWDLNGTLFGRVALGLAPEFTLL